MKRGAYAYVALALVSVVLSAASLLGAISYYHASQASQQRQDAAVAASQKAQSEAFEQKLCATLDRLAALKPPPGSPAGNPSRAYLQQQHAVLAELGPDVGCRP